MKGLTRCNLEVTMPLYDCQCKECGAVQLDVVHSADNPPPPCTGCGAATEHIWLTAPLFKSFHAGYYEHLAPEPMHFDDRGKLREYCNEHDLRMDQLE